MEVGEGHGWTDVRRRERLDYIGKKGCRSLRKRSVIIRRMSEGEGFLKKNLYPSQGKGSRGRTPLEKEFSICLSQMRWEGPERKAGHTDKPRSREGGAL